MNEKSRHLGFGVFIDICSMVHGDQGWENLCRVKTYRRNLNCGAGKATVPKVEAGIDPLM
jgi:hypothetical protein